jgi:diaminopimelate epimerase
MRFSKWHGLGNDYLLVERSDAGFSLPPGLVQRLCDRHLGVGADGLLEIVSVDGARAGLVIWNRDGSTAELSGNGTRIAARWLARESGADEVLIVVGSREVVGRMRGPSVVEMELGPVAVSPPEALDVAGEAVEVVPVTVGNPHAVLRREPARAELLRLGPQIETHPRFPGRTNVQLVRVDGLHEVTARVWERGVGETSSSGTSACAVAAAAIANGWCESPVTVHLPAGDLVVGIDARWRATLSGPVQEICRGEIGEDLLAEVL